MVTSPNNPICAVIIKYSLCGLVAGTISVPSTFFAYAEANSPVPTPRIGLSAITFRVLSQNSKRNPADESLCATPGDHALNSLPRDSTRFDIVLGTLRRTIIPIVTATKPPSASLRVRRLAIVQAAKAARVMYPVTPATINTTFAQARMATPAKTARITLFLGAFIASHVNVKAPNAIK
jgi:hypothetical protein